MELSEIVDTSAASPAPEPESVQAPEPAAEVPKGEPIESAPPAEAKTDEPTESPDSRTVPLKALQEEREKRQKRDQRIAELEQSYNALASRIPETVATPQDPEPDPEKIREDYYRDPIAWTEAKLGSQQSQFEKSLQEQRLATSEAIMRSQVSDYDEVIAEFVKAATANPALSAQMHADPAPAQYAYKAGKLYMETEGIGSVDALREKIREEERQKIKAELDAAKAEVAAEAITPSNAGARGASGATAAAIFTGPVPLETLFPR